MFKDQMTTKIKALGGGWKVFPKYVEAYKVLWCIVHWTFFFSFYRRGMLKSAKSQRSKGGRFLTPVDRELRAQTSPH